uniref:Uncharacterized protein n=1 Tax=Anguilla anguilla TaxID=7936 RepID=A0A0E9QH47_ANGAN
MKLCLRKRLQISAERRSVGGICEFPRLRGVPESIRAPVWDEEGNGRSFSVD